MVRDRVSPELAAAVIRRDELAMIRAGLVPKPVCLAPVIDSTQSGSCWGRSTLDHVKEQPRMSVRATSIPTHLATLCQGHTEDGRKAGYQWNTAHRPELREHLQKEGAIDREATG